MLKKIRKERFIWLDIMITLFTLEIMAYFYYGARTFVMSAVCICVSLIAEILSLRLMRRKFRADDLTCTSDALIISLMMPAVIDFRLPAIACIFAVVAAKNVFGGRINMIFSPSAVAYLFLLVSWKKELLSYPKPHTISGIFEKVTDLTSSASYNFNTKGNMSASDFEILLGNFSGPIGAVSILLLVLSAIMLIFRKDISKGAFIGTITGTAIIAYICPISVSGLASVKYALVTNMVLFAAIYIISDLRIAPKKNYYAFFYGFFIAVFSYIIVVTTGKENVIVIMSVLFTPVSLAFKNLERKIASILFENSKNSNEKSSGEILKDNTETETPEVCNNINENTTKESDETSSETAESANNETLSVGEVKNNNEQP